MRPTINAVRSILVSTASLAVVAGGVTAAYVVPSAGAAGATGAASTAGAAHVSMRDAMPGSMDSMRMGAGAKATKATKAAKVSVVDDRFMPKNLTVKLGGTVTWVWKGYYSHNVTIAGPVKHHSRTQQSGTYKVKFTKVGTYRVRCTIHQDEGMRMVVKVVR